MPDPGLRRSASSNQTIEERVDFAKVTQNLGDPDDGESFCVDNRLAAGVAHPGSANAEKFERWIAAFRAVDQPPRLVHFTGGLAGGDENFHESTLSSEIRN